MKVLIFISVVIISAAIVIPTGYYLSKLLSINTKNNDTVIDSTYKPNHDSDSALNCMIQSIVYEDKSKTQDIAYSIDGQKYHLILKQKYMDTSEIYRHKQIQFEHHK